MAAFGNAEGGQGRGEGPGDTMESVYIETTIVSYLISWPSRDLMGEWRHVG